MIVTRYIFSEKVDTDPHFYTFIINHVNPEMKNVKDIVRHFYSHKNINFLFCKLKEKNK